MNIAIYTLTSALHDAQAIQAATKEFLGSLSIEYDFKDNDFSDYGTHALDLIYVRTGGTEGIFKPMLLDLLKKQRTIFLLTSGKSNSLAASMEILSYLRQQHIRGEIIHGSAAYISQRIKLLEQVGKARKLLAGCRLGMVGEPSDWLISSHTNVETVRMMSGISLCPIPMTELMKRIDALTEETPVEHSDNPIIQQALPGADRIYRALKQLVADYQLQGLTLRCFDLLSSVKNTGCLALAKLNQEGIVAGCEGDVPTMITMMIARALLGVSGFQANPAHIDPETGEMLFAHCTIPLDMVERYEFDTHYESGIGVGIRGYMKEGDVTVFKVSAGLNRWFIAEGTLVRNQAKPDLCRTQQVIQLSDKTQAVYFMKNPIGNHHVILPGHHKALLEQIVKSF
jgi:L-fucose isomerase-like protein